MFSVQNFPYRLAILLFASVVLTACGGSDTLSAHSVANTAANRQVVPFPAKPPSDPFYRPPKSVPDLPAGTILKSRQVTLAPALGIPLPLFKAWQLQFVSHDSHGRRIAAIATVVKPLESTNSNRLLAYQYAVDSLGRKCSPSRTLTGSTDNLNSQLQGLGPVPGLLQGWTVVYPDYQGPTKALAASRLEGQVVLDSIRAALRFKPLGLDRNTPVAMWGYSGGALATAWAATLQAGYAPELNIVGVASGGTPANLVGVAKGANEKTLINETTFFRLAFSAVIGINREYPNFVTPILNDKGRAAAKAVANGCLGATTNGAPSPTPPFSKYTTTSKPFKAPSVQAVVPKIILPQPDSTPIADTFVYHSQFDQLVPIAGADAMVKAWCNRGATVHYYRGVTGGHIVFGASMVPFVLAYLNSRFSGQPPALPPGTVSCN